MLDAAIKGQLNAYLEKLQTPIELVASLDFSEKNKAKSQEMLSLLEEITALSNKVSLRQNGEAQFKPSFTVGAVGSSGRIQFAGIPMGHEFTSLVLALLHHGWMQKPSSKLNRLRVNLILKSLCHSHATTVRMLCKPLI
jgi:alkyl hydroperoxide reductase subunit F